MWCRLSDVAEIIMGSSPSGNNICDNSQYTEFHQGKIYFSDYMLDRSNQYTKEVTKMASSDSILLCVRAPVGEVNITDRPVCIGRGLVAIKPYTNVSEIFLFFCFQAFKPILVSKATGTTFAAISSDVVKRLVIPIPPIKEQDQIIKSINNYFNQLANIEKSLN